VLKILNNLDKILILEIIINVGNNSNIKWKVKPIIVGAKILFIIKNNNLLIKVMRLIKTRT